MEALRQRLDYELPAIGEHGGDRVSDKAHDQVGNLNLVQANSSDYKLARMKRDAPV